MPLQWRNQFKQSLEEGAGKRALWSVNLAQTILPLSGNRTKTSWPPKNVQIFPFQICTVMSSLFMQQKYILELYLHCAHPRLLDLYYSTFCLGAAVHRRCQSRKKLTRDVIGTCATHAGPVDDVKDTDCQTQNGSAQDRAFATFKRRFVFFFFFFLYNKLDRIIMTRKTAVSRKSTF